MALAMTILTVAMWVVLALVGVIVFLLNMPYRARVTATWNDTQKSGRAWLGWPARLLGVMAEVSFDQQELCLFFMGIRLRSWSFREMAKKKKRRDETVEDASEDGPRKKTKKKRKPRTAAERLYLMRMPDKRYALEQFAGWLYMRASLEGRFGFDDPSTTAELAMALALVGAVFPSIGRDVVLDYAEPAFEGRLTLSMMVWLPRILVGATVFLLSRRGRGMLRYYFARPKPAKATV